MQTLLALLHSGISLLYSSFARLDGSFTLTNTIFMCILAAFNRSDGVLAGLNGKATFFLGLETHARRRRARQLALPKETREKSRRLTLANAASAFSRAATASLVAASKGSRA